MSNVASEHAVEFVKSALQKDQNERPTIAQLLKSKWMEDLQTKRNFTEEDELDLSSNIVAFAKATTF